MFRKTISILVLILMPYLLFAQAVEECFLQLQFYSFSHNEYQSLGATSTDLCMNAQGMYFKKNKQTGIKGGIINTEDSVQFEILYSLRSLEVRGVNRLYGTCYSMVYDDNSAIISGVKINIDTIIVKDEELKIDVGKLPDGNKVFIGITLTDNIPVFRDERAAITLIVGDYTGFNSVNNKDILEETTLFTTGTGKRVNGKINQLKYRIEINLPDIPQNITAPVQTELHFKRKYLIDEDFYDMKSFKTDYTYTSEFTKKINLIPGETIMLVFPPDTPSVHGFNMTDTLFIRP